MKSQTATEYLIILAVVIVIALIVVGILGQTDSGESASSLSQQKAQNARIGVSQLAVGTTDSLFVSNNQNVFVTLTQLNLTVNSLERRVINPSSNLSLRPGDRQQLSFYEGVTCTAGTEVGVLIETCFVTQTQSRYCDSNTVTVECN